LSGTDLERATPNPSGPLQRAHTVVELDARQRADAIRSHYEQAWELLVAAYRARDWATLGYSSWDAYCSAEFGDKRLKLPTEVRRGIVASLREDNLSIRAIASALGASTNTVASDLEVSQTAAPDAVVGRDSKTYTPRREPRSQPRDVTPKLSLVEHLEHDVWRALNPQVHTLSPDDRDRLRRIANEIYAELDATEPTVIDAEVTE
jgi:hypothetical protein